MAKKRKTKSTPVSQVRLGRLQHESLTPEQEDLARHIYDACGHLVYPTFEQWELGFLRDSNPVQELTLWAIIANTLAQLGPMYPEDEPEQLLGEIVAYSTGGKPTKYPEIAKIYAAVSKEVME